MELRDYQKKISGQAVDLLTDFKICYLTMEVRTGKTLTALFAADIYFKSLPARCGERFVLFITKKKAISSIENDAILLNPDYELFITNYESVSKLIDKDFDLIICDESHCLGQFPKPAERTKKLKKLCNGKPIIYLSGTPTPESYSQIFHQLWISSFSPFKEENFYKWHKVYGIPNYKFLYGRQIADYSQCQKSAIDKINHLFITYTQKQAGFECNINEEIFWVPMSDKKMLAIKKLQRDKILKTKSGHIILADTAVKEMQKIHQICSGTVKSESGNAIIFDDSKATFIMKKFKDKKISIFYKFIAEGEMLKNVFGSRVVVTPEDFNIAGGDCVFISQIQSGREGINLSTSDYIIFFNIDFSATSYWQAISRSQTKDRKKLAKVAWIFTKGGIEEKIYKMVQQKKDFTLNHYKKEANQLIP